MHEANETDEPGWGHEVRAPIHVDAKTAGELGKELHEDTVDHENLSTVNQQSWEVADKEHHDNADKDSRKVCFITSRDVPLG